MALAVEAAGLSVGTLPNLLWSGLQSPLGRRHDYGAGAEGSVRRFTRDVTESWAGAQQGVVARITGDAAARK